MKANACFLFLLIWMPATIQAQHNIALQAGITISNLQKYGSKVALENISLYGDIYNTTPLYCSYLSVEYEFDYKSYRFSTGLSFLSMGANRFVFEDSNTGEAYLTIPILAGKKWTLPKDFSITVEIGIEPGIRILNIGQVALASRNKIGGNIGAAMGVEASWKNLRIGARLHIGLTDYFIWETSGSDEKVYFKHASGTVYLGYTLWKSGEVEKRKLEKLD